MPFLLSYDTTYQVRVYDAVDQVVGVYDNLVNVAYQKEIMRPGMALLTVPDGHPMLALMELDVMVGIHVAYVLSEVAAGNPYGLGWKEDFVGLYRNEEIATDEHGNLYHILMIVGLNDVLARQIIAWRSGVNNRTSWVGQQAAIIAYELATTNATAYATVANGRLVDASVVRNCQANGIAPGTVAIDYSVQLTNLLDTLRELAEIGAFEFEVRRHTAGVLDVVHGGPMFGTDRSTYLIFDLALDNLGSASLDRDRLREKTVAVVGGVGTGATRAFDVTLGTNWAPNNAFEVYVDARQHPLPELPVIGEAAMGDYEAKSAVEAGLVMSRGVIYLRDYALYDTVSVRLAGVVVPKRIQRVEVSFGLGYSGRVRLGLEDL